MYIAPKSTNELTAHFSPGRTDPTRGGRCTV